MLVHTLQVDIAQVHEEACRWEHVMSELIEQRISTLLNNPQYSPFGNAIPGMSENLPAISVASLQESLTPGVNQIARVIRISEVIQVNSALVESLFAQNIKPGHDVTIASVENHFVLNGDVTLTIDQAQALWVQI